MTRPKPYIWKPKNPKKYIGDPNTICVRSSWERKVCIWLDTSADVLEWSSEEIVIPYISPADGRYHRYFPDFFVKIRSKDGTIKNMILEVKPHSQAIEPVKKTKITKRYINEVVTYGVNQAKWKAAEEYCKDRKWEFKVLTEFDLGIR